ncbi:MAG TPA: hypothetical protein VFG05_02725 [Methylocella sp.]|nr:hypothetical protein [Methylocella sp.]
MLFLIAKQTQNQRQKTARHARAQTRQAEGFANAPIPEECTLASFGIHGRDGIEPLNTKVFFMSRPD